MTVGPTLERGSGWTVLDTQRSLYMQTKTAHRHPCGPRWTAPQVALWTSALSRFSSHFARPNGYLDSGFLVRISRFPRALSRARRGGREARGVFGLPFVMSPFPPSNPAFTGFQSAHFSIFACWFLSKMNKFDRFWFCRSRCSKRKKVKLVHSDKSRYLFTKINKVKI